MFKILILKKIGRRKKGDANLYLINNLRLLLDNITLPLNILYQKMLCVKCGLKWIIGFGFVNVFSNWLTIITPLKRTGPSFEKKFFSTKNDLYQFGQIWHSGSKGRLFNLIIPIFSLLLYCLPLGMVWSFIWRKVNFLHWILSLIVFWVYHNNYLPLVHWFCRRSCLNLVVTVALFYYGDIIFLE